MAAAALYFGALIAAAIGPFAVLGLVCVWRTNPGRGRAGHTREECEL